MFLKSAELNAHSLVQNKFLFILFFLITTKFALADWNSGVTIEDVATRIAVNVLDKGIQVTIDLKANAVKQLEKGGAQQQPMTVDNFSLSVIEVNAKQQLIPIIKKSQKKNNKATASGSTIDVFYPFPDDTKPKQISINPSFKLIKQAGEQYIITVSHHGLPVIDHGVLTQAETLSLNWQDPWYSHFLNPELKRDHNDPVMAFLYIEPRQIKSEFVIRIKEIADWANLELRDDVMIYPDEFALIKQKVGEFLLAQNNLSADAKLLSPTLERVDYIRMGAADIQAYEPQQAQRQVATLIGVSLTHQTKNLPEKVEWKWKLFNKKIQRVSIRAYDPAGLFDSYVTPDYPVFEWENMLADIDLTELSGSQKASPVPVEESKNTSQYYWLSAVIGLLLLPLIGCHYINPRFKFFIQLFIILITLAASFSLIKTGKLNVAMKSISLDDENAKPILKQLLWNIYQAFESTHEEVAYDQLADSVSGNLRETLYLQNRQSFLAQDGAWSKVKSIEIQKLSNQSSILDGAYLFDCEWLVVGEVIHWGHQHRRENLYRANIKISPLDGYWKIFQLESIGQQRVDETKPKKDRFTK
ncbi:MAG: hypothetical protein L3J59_02630 [Methylococcaceae bacterium]|nr:hypothetical protein [Methylococcaceae bacterium]